MFEQMIIQAAISFALRQLDKFQDSIDWEKVKEDIGPRIEDLVPGQIFDDVAKNLVSAVIDKISSIIQATNELKIILECLGKKDLTGALSALKNLILKNVLPQQPVASLSEAQKDVLIVKAFSKAA